MALDLPVVYLLSTFIEPNKVLDLQSAIPALTHDVTEADVVVANLSQPARVRFELRRLGLVTEPLPLPLVASTPEVINLDSPPSHSHAPPSIDSSDTASEADFTHLTGMPPSARRVTTDRGEPVVRVVKLAWLTSSLEHQKVLPLDDYLLYQGVCKTPSTSDQPKTPEKPAQSRTDDILTRAQLDAPGATVKSAYPHGFKRHHERSSPASQSKRPRLLQETTSEHDIGVHLPPVPAYLHTTYSCQRPSPADPPNDAFIEQLKTIRTFRTLMNDKIGVRAYSTAIAALSAYPHALVTPMELERLPGCRDKIAAKWNEWRENGFLKENVDAAMDERLAVLKLFYNIWGVGEATAREFYNKGWRDLDDIIEHGWDSITRVQQIGIKYYDEFLNRIPRQETHGIGEVILEHANKIHPNFDMVIVGSYRRGRKDSGDVDVVLTHRDETVTHHFIEKVVISLENDKHITHTLTLSTRNSERGQCPLPWKGDDRKPGSGFDTLDKALVVWQDPDYDQSKHSRNPNPHRRVDIIISPWKTAGCAVIGWSGGTTFERDLRRYCKKERRLKFDSSGVRSRTDGRWVDLESDLGGPAPDLLTAEKRVFAGLGLEWRVPEERVTG